MDAMKMMRVADRILKGMMEYFRCEQFTKKCFTANRSAVVLSKSIGVRVWCDSANFYKCLGVSEEISNHFMRFGIRTVSTLLQTEPHVMENVCFQSDLTNDSEFIESEVFLITSFRWLRKVLHLERIF